MPAEPVGPADDFEPPIRPLGNSGSTFHPIAGVHIANPIDHMNGGVMDVAADYAGCTGIAGRSGKLLLKISGIAHDPFDPVFQKGGKRPVWKADSAPAPIKKGVGRGGNVVCDIADNRKPQRLLYDGVELVAMDDEKAASIGGAVDRMEANLDRPKRRAGEGTHLAIVIAGDVNDTRAVLRLCQ